MAQVDVHSGLIDIRGLPWVTGVLSDLLIRHS